MKKQIITYLSILLLGAFILQSCAPESEPIRSYYSLFGTVQTEDNLNFTVRLDNGDLLIPDKLTIEGIEQDRRVLMQFYVISIDTTTNDKIINAEVIDMLGVHTADIIQLTEEIEDSIGTDGIMVDESNVWLSEKHLNIGYGFYGGNAVHEVSLVTPIGDVVDEEGNLILEFRHNANGDFMNNYYTGMVAFSMDSLHEVGMDSINFIFQSYDYDSIRTEVKGTYYFYNPIPEKKSLNMGPIGFDAMYSYQKLL